MVLLGGGILGVVMSCFFVTLSKNCRWATEELFVNRSAALPFDGEVHVAVHVAVLESYNRCLRIIQC